MNPTVHNPDPKNRLADLPIRQDPALFRDEVDPIRSIPLIVGLSSSLSTYGVIH